MMYRGPDDPTGQTVLFQDSLEGGSGDHYQKGPGLDMEETPTPTEDSSTKVIGYIGPQNKRASKEKGNRKS